jgi:hypothetical protein
MNQSRNTEEFDDTPSPLAVKCGRFVFCLVGLIFFSIAGWFLFKNPDQQALLAAGTMGTGFLLVWLGIALPPKLAAHLGFWLPWFLPSYA